MPMHFDDVEHPLGMKIIGYMEDGRPIIENMDGSVTTDAAITVEVEPGRWMNIPTIFRGSYVTPEEALKLVKDRGFKDLDTGQALPSFTSRKDAEQFAQNRFQRITAAAFGVRQGGAEPPSAGSGAKEKT